MPRRYKNTTDTTHPLKNLALALRVSLKHGYGLLDFKSDLIAGIIVGIVALPLSMALAIASGVPPQHGLYTAIVAGSVVALLGGSRFNVTGPTAAFVVILLPIATKLGLGGLLMATVLAGLMQIAMGAAKLGQLIQFIPHPVTTGFTSGIAVVIATLQIKDFFGLTLIYPNEHYVTRLVAIVHALPTVNLGDTAIGSLTLMVLIVLPYLTKKIPAPLVAIILASVAGLALTHFWPNLTLVTIGSRFTYQSGVEMLHGIPQLPPVPVLPWALPGPNGAPLAFTWSRLQSLLAAGFTIAMLGAIESLLCAVVSDGMAGSRHDPDAELFAQGIGNVVAPFFGGIAATGALARTATSIRSGARSPLAGFMHAVFILLVVLIFAPLLSYIPMAALAALLLVVAWNMSEAKHFIHILKVAPHSDTIVLITCFALTVIFDMVVAVGAGIVLAAMLFLRRMIEISDVKLYNKEEHPHHKLPKGVVLYEINGPIFFGAAEKAMSAIEEISGDVKTVILDISSAPAIDATGLVALESAIEKLHSNHALVLLVGARPQPVKALVKAGFKNVSGKFHFCSSMKEALDLV